MIPLHTRHAHPPTPTPVPPRPPLAAPDAHDEPGATARPVAAADEGAPAGATRADAETTQRIQAEAAQIRELAARDREVRAHERAHASAAAGIAHSAPSYTYQRGPNGRQYAVGGEVRIDTSPVPGDPAATLDKARQIARAALAPAEPSSQDRAVAARARAMAAAAQAELQAAQGEGEGDAAAGGARGPVDGSGAAARPSDADGAAACVVCGGAHSAAGHLEQSYGGAASDAAHQAPLALRA